MARRIDNPILNSPFEEPNRHFRFDAEGITDDVVESRRPSQYTVPVPPRKTKGRAQLELSFTEVPEDRIEENRLVNLLRDEIARWRLQGYQGARRRWRTGRNLPGTTSFLLWYARDVDSVKYRQVFREKRVGGEGAEAYSQVQLADGSRRRLTALERSDPSRIPSQARPFRLDNLTSSRVRAARTGYFPIEFDGRSHLPGEG